VLDGRIVFELSIESLIAPFVERRNPLIVIPLLSSTTRERMFMNVALDILKAKN
jgi:hypothetical protein